MKQRSHEEPAPHRSVHEGGCVANSVRLWAQMWDGEGAATTPLVLAGDVAGGAYAYEDAHEVAGEEGEQAGEEGGLPLA